MVNTQSQMIVVNFDVAMEVLRHCSTIDRCRMRRISRAFNLASIRLVGSLKEAKISDFLLMETSKPHQLLGLLRFLTTHCKTLRKLTDLTLDDDSIALVLDDKVMLAKLFRDVEFMTLKCRRLANYRLLSAFVGMFKRLAGLSIIGRYPMPVEHWDDDESEFASTLVQLTHLRRLELINLELKGEVLTAINDELRTLVIRGCADIYDSYLATMAVWCIQLESLELEGVEVSLETFRLLCQMSRLTRLTLVFRRCLTIDWLLCICESNTIREAAVGGIVGPDFRDWIRECPWPLRDFATEVTDDAGSGPITIHMRRPGTSD